MGKEKNEPSEVRKHLASNVARLRIARGLSQSQLGLAIGESRYVVTDIETERNNINQDVLAALATVFDVSVDALLGRVVAVDDSDDQLEQLLAACRTLNPTQREAVSQVLTMQLRAFGVLR